VWFKSTAYSAALPEENGLSSFGLTYARNPASVNTVTRRIPAYE